jgi:hypothetical protein
LGGVVCGGALCAHAREARVNITANRKLLRFIRLILPDIFVPSICLDPAVNTLLQDQFTNDLSRREDLVGLDYG